ncbi:uncharacterized protein LOC142774200 isoform X2 [Rhipicephalus microplus]|uniref:uncharacterized protein LOC142774200 isoform X2 n=1 Tax=Rhipicephalus microplus TaxID=6941 RepID=UPI003F6D39FD
MKKARLLTLVSVHMKWGPSYDVEALHGLSDLLIVHAYSKEDSPKTAVPPIIFKEDLICLEFSSDLWVSLYDKEADCKIAVNRDKGQWIGYDNKATILNKVLFAKRMRMGGIAVVTVDMDDYNGDCGQRNVLLGQLHNALNELDRPIRRLPANLSLPPLPATTARAGLYQTDHGRQARTTRPDGRRQA